MIVTTVLSHLTMDDLIIVMDFLSSKGYKQPCLVFFFLLIVLTYKWHSVSSISKQINKIFSYYYYYYYYYYC
jgi:hypothetical protein